MWTKQVPIKNGYYWARSPSELSGKIYTRPVHLYNNQQIVFSDGKIFGAQVMNLEWWDVEIEQPDMSDIKNEDMKCPICGIACDK